MDTSWTRSDYTGSCEAQALKQSVQHHPPTVAHNAKYLGACVTEPEPMDIDVDAEDSRPLKRARWDEDEGETLARRKRILEVEGDHVRRDRGARNSASNRTPTKINKDDNPNMTTEELQEAREYIYDADDDEGYISGFETKVGSGDENEIYLEDSSYRRPREDATRHYHTCYGNEGLERISNFKAEGQRNAEPGWDGCDMDARLAAILTDSHRHVFYSFDDAGFEI